MKILSVLYITVSVISISCAHKAVRNERMINLLSDIDSNEYNVQNPFRPEARLKFYDSLLRVVTLPSERANIEYYLANTWLQEGEEQKAISMFEGLMSKIPENAVDYKVNVMKDLAIAYLRLGERMNCIYNHTSESCIFPISGKGVHYNKTGSERAIEVYQALLRFDPTDLESRWLLNVAYMTTGGYPGSVPPDLLLKGLDKDSATGIKPFIDVAVNVGLNTKNMAGGSIVEDFNNDGYLDLVTSGWGLQEGLHYCRNNTDGSFTDVSDSSGLSALKGGLNIQQTDYNNDGLVDIFVLRGAWKGKFGKEPKSLLRNNGDGTFTDVTEESGLLSFHPTQTATWADFNNDGWLDVFIGHENTIPEEYNPCEFYRNNKDGTFTEMAIDAGCNVVAFVKGVTSGDYDNDGLPDIFISTLSGDKILLKNESRLNGVVRFKDVSAESGINKIKSQTFPTWFWDYNNDGWLDILVSSYEFDKSLSYYAAAENLHMPLGNSAKIFLFQNKHDGTFEDVTDKVGLNKVAFAMGSNFGDIDNDGFLDIYLGTGNPLYRSLVPNKMFKNINGTRFMDVTTSARVGNLQKGHGVSFADMDNDGDEDIHIDMGGAYIGDAYQNSFYINPGQNTNNHWITLSLEGTHCNKAAIGARIKVTFKENGAERSVYRDVNSGGSFGSNPLRQHIGIGSATAIESVEIKWPGNNTPQVIKNIQPGDFAKIKEGSAEIKKVQLKKCDFINGARGIVSCTPAP
jgi:FG-GAP-like repeat/ASPIC and UnbV